MSRPLAFELSPSRCCSAAPLLAIALTLALVGAAPQTALGQPRVAVLPLDVNGQLASRALQVLDQRLSLGVTAAGMTVVGGSLAKMPLPSSGGCGPACRQGLASQLSARFVAGGRVAVRYDDYQISLWLADGRTGRTVSELERRCDVCGISAAAETMDLAASELVARQRVEREAPATLVITTQPAAAELVVDDRPVGRAPQTLSLAAGPHRLEARAAGHLSERRTITSTAGERLALSLVLLPSAAASSADAADAAPGVLPPWRRTSGWSAVVTGVAAIVGGVALLLVDGNAVDCSAGRTFGEVCRGERRTATLGWTLLGTGVAAAATGSLLLTLR
ncbi:MAG: PEGA domain-containing protein [Proteobacteria bacterium]|nr:PEGA domain-containing protein [Pseudomonadota bacterium]